MVDAMAALRRHYGFDRFRPAQLPVVSGVLAGHDVLGVLPTGGGKSVCFQVPAALGDGVTVVISPLISLMQDQVDAARARGFAAVGLHTALTAEERARAAAALRGGTARLLYVSPERAPRLAEWLAARGRRVQLLAVDEAHCIAEWGHDFRPSYRALAQVRARLGDPPVVALTGSATPAVRREIVSSLGLGRSRRLVEHLGSFDRPNLWFGAVHVRDDRERRAALLRELAEARGTAIVYAPTRGLCEALTVLLRHAGRRAAPYHAGLPADVRRSTLEAFLRDDLDVVVATSAFGMGIDKPTVRLVVHWTMSPTPESYYQEAGRGGRDGGVARCMLLYRPGDGGLARRMLEVTFPPERLVGRLWAGTAPATVPSGVRASAERLRAELEPERGRVDWRPVRRRRAAALERIRAMERYATARGCRRAVLIDWFGERIRRCAGCDRCGR